MNGDRWISRRRPVWGARSVARAIVFFSLVLGTALGVQGQATRGEPSQVVASGAKMDLPAKWSEGVKAVAGKIAAAVKPSSAISLEVKNISSFEAEDVEAVRKALEAELGLRGIRMAAGGTEARVTLSEDIDGYVWVVVTQTSNTNHVDLVAVAKPADSSSSAKPTPILQRRIVWRQKKPILDFAIRVFSPGLFDVSYATILEPKQLHTFELRFGEWSEKNSATIPETQGPRDLRGFLVPNGDQGVKAYAGKEACLGLFSSPYCGESSSQDWPLPGGLYARFVGNRNYFSGFAKDSSNLLEQRPFYTAAIGLNIFDHSTPIVTTEMDGEARLYHDAKAPKGVFTGWGDDIASIKPSCGVGWQILVTGTGDWMQPDHIQLYEVSFRNDAPTAKSEGQPLQFPGPVLAMWESGDQKSARVVSRNLQTGMYEASIVTVSCSQ